MARAHHWAIARWWVVGTLSLATLALAGWLTLLALMGAMASAAMEVLRAESPAVLDLTSLVTGSLPALLVGWCLGLAATAVLSRGETLGPRLTGITGALVGTVAGALVLRLTGLL